MTNTNINFNKRKLESLKSSTKPTWYYAQNFEGLALLVGKKKKAYYAHWSIPVVDKITGNIKMVGKRKKLDGFYYWYDYDQLATKTHHIIYKQDIESHDKPSIF